MGEFVTGGATRARPWVARLAGIRPARRWLPALGLGCWSVAASHFGWWVAALVIGVSCFLLDAIYDPKRGVYSDGS